MYIYICVCVCVCVYPEVGLVDHVAILLLISQGTANLSPLLVFHNSYTNIHSTFSECTRALFSTLLPAFTVGFLSDNSCSNRHTVTLCGLPLPFPND